MGFILAIAISLMVFVSTICSSFAGPDTNPIGQLTQKCDWKFIQSVGGIRAGTPIRDHKGIVLLPVECDVSGLRKITVEPGTMNSGWALKKVDVRVKQNEIHLTVVTTLGQDALGSSPRGPVKLGKLTAGTYKVFYDSADGVPVPMGEVVVPE